MYPTHSSSVPKRAQICPCVCTHVVVLLVDRLRLPPKAGSHGETLVSECPFSLSLRRSTSCRRATSIRSWRRSRWRRRWRPSERWSVVLLLVKRYTVEFYTCSAQICINPSLLWDVSSRSEAGKVSRYSSHDLPFQCSYTYFKPADRCVEENHNLRWHDATKRFFKCPCGQRAIALDRLPNKTCGFIFISYSSCLVPLVPTRTF